MGTSERMGFSLTQANQSLRGRIARTTRRVIALHLALALVLTATSQPATGVAVEQVSRRSVAPGVVHTVIRKRKPRLVIHVVKADLRGRATIKPALARGILPGLETTSSMARRRGAVAAINGDFFHPSGRPIAAFARSGQLAQTALMPGANFAIARADEGMFIGHRRISATVTDLATGRTMPVGRVNAGKPGETGLALFTPDGGRLEMPPKGACSARLRETGPYRADQAGAMSAPFRVTRVACRKRPMTRAGGTVLSARWLGTRRRDVKQLVRGQQLSITWRAGWPKVGDTIGGNPVLIRNGRIEWDSLSGSHYIFARHPRSGVGLTKDGKVLFVTVDGRRPRHSVGMKLPAFAKLFKSLGAAWALNLDGGGSTTMVVRGKVVNRPSDRRERPVGSALLVTMESGGARKSSVDPGAETVEPDSQDTISSAAALDPASIGGMASWLESRGEIPQELQGVADRFNARAESGALPGGLPFLRPGLMGR